MFEAIQLQELLKLCTGRIAVINSSDFFLAAMGLKCLAKFLNCSLRGYIMHSMDIQPFAWTFLMIMNKVSKQSLRVNATMDNRATPMGGVGQLVASFVRVNMQCNA